MNINFPLVLMILVAISGVITLADKLYFSKKRSSSETIPGWIEQSKSFFPLLLVVFVLRSFIVEPFQIPSASMEPTLIKGDFILVNKFHYGIRLPVFRNKIIDFNDPQRGDVMVFFPPHDKRYFIKRVVGLPGDEVSIKGTYLYVNGKKQDIEPSKVALMDPMKIAMVENLDGRKHLTQWLEVYDPRFGVKTTAGKEGTWKVPNGHYFMMGDNRAQSSDSRYWQTVPEKNIVGHAMLKWIFWDDFLSIPSFKRVGWIE
jgi:signal peptidase I